MRVDILINSCRRDLCWLSYCLQFLYKNWREDSRIIVKLDEDCREIVAEWKVNGVEYVYGVPWPDTYNYQMFLKLNSDHETDAELILCVDSDLMLFEPADLSLLMTNGKPNVFYRHWIEPGEEIAHRVWRNRTSHAMGMDLDCDYMVNPPFLYWRDTFAKTRAQIEKTVGCSLHDYMYSETPFTVDTFTIHPMRLADFEALGLCAAKLQTGRYEVMHYDKRVWPYHTHNDWPFRLYWSHQAFTQELQHEFDERLAAD